MTTDLTEFNRKKKWGIAGLCGWAVAIGSVIAYIYFSNRQRLKAGKPIISSDPGQ
jgi:hypothetical protein